MLNEVICRKVLRAAYMLADGQQECSVTSSRVAGLMGISNKYACRVLAALDQQRMVTRIGTGGVDVFFWLTPQGVWQVEQGFPNY